MQRFFKWIKEGAGSRSMQMTVMQNGKFEAIAIEKGVMVAKGEGTTGDGALINLSVGIMNVVGKPAGARMPL
jgi:hypothetical protein